MALFKQGHSFVAGLDEAGRGCLAGPVVAAAVILPLEERTLTHLEGVTDSKQLTHAQRERLYEVVMRHAIAVGVGSGSVELIDARNILQATKQAMRDALTQLTPPPHALLLDALLLPDITLPQRSIIKGDAHCLSIAAASIIAKTTRDAHMLEMDRAYSGYGFASHKGYPTPEHCRALKELGALPIHRRSFGRVREVLGLDPIQPDLFEAESEVSTSQAASG